MWHCQLHGISFVWSDGCPACKDSGEADAARSKADPLAQAEEISRRSHPPLSWDDPNSDPVGDVRRAVADLHLHAPCENRIADLQRENDRLQRENNRLRAGRGGWGDR
jgi:hypothetical protein